MANQRSPLEATEACTPVLVSGVGADRRPERIGPYTILGLLGEGGMGSVFLAAQSEPVAREVAIKVTRAGRLSGGSERARFDAERQAMARLSHPFVAQIFEAGTTEEGYPYFVMEHVPGERVTDFCDRRGLPLAARLSLFADICQGVQHAHQKGILHRDLKPSNILVIENGDRAVPKIIDFGVAKALDRPLAGGAALTGFNVVGTPQYLSPESLEVAAGAERQTDLDTDLDTRADVYSLGILLYELVSGTHPHADPDSTVARILIKVLREEPPAPSRRYAALAPAAREKLAAERALTGDELARRLRGDLDAIVLKAIARQRQQRYDGATELAADLRCYLANEPVAAAAGGRAYRLSKFVRRHRLAVGAGAVIALALALGTVGIGVGLLRARRAEAVALREAERANREARTVQQVSGFLVDLFTISDPGEAQGSSVTARALLDQAAQRLPAELEQQPAVRTALMQTIGVVYRNLGLYDSARDMLTRAVAGRGAVFGESSLEVAESLTDLGALSVLQARYDDAERELQRALAIREERLGLEDPATATTLNHLGIVRSKRGLQDEAAKLYERVLAIRERSLGPKHSDVATTLNNLGNIYRRQGRFEDAERAHLRALAIREELLGAEHPDTALIVSNLGILYRAAGRLDESEAAYRRVLAVETKVLEADHPRLANTQNNLGNLLMDRHRLEEASVHLTAALGIRKRLFGEHHPDTAISRNNLGQLHREMGRYREAEPLVRAAVADLEAALGPTHPHVAASLRNLGGLLWEDGRPAEAEPVLRRALAIHEERLGADNPETLITAGSLAAVLRDRGRREESAQLFQRALAGLSRTASVSPETRAEIEREYAKLGAARPVAIAPPVPPPGLPGADPASGGRDGERLR